MSAVPKPCYTKVLMHAPECAWVAENLDLLYERYAAAKPNGPFSQFCDLEYEIAKGYEMDRREPPSAFTELDEEPEDSDDEEDDLPW